MSDEVKNFIQNALNKNEKDLEIARIRQSRIEWKQKIK